MDTLQRWRSNLARLNERVDRAMNPFFEYLAYLAGIASGANAGFVLRLDGETAAISLALAVFFVSGGLAIRSLNSDRDRRASRRWQGLAFGSIGIPLTVLAIRWTAGSDVVLDGDTVALFLVSVGMSVAGLYFVATAHREEAGLDPDEPQR